MNQSVENAVMAIIKKLLTQGAKEVLLTTPSPTKDTMEITVDKNARIFVSNINIRITVSATANNVSLPGCKEIKSDKNRVYFLFGVKDPNEVAKAADIISKID